LGFSNHDEKASAEAERLRIALAELDVLREIAAETESDQPLQDTIDNITDRCVACFGVEQGAVHLLDAGGKGTAARTVVRQAGSRVGGQSFRPTEQLVGWMLKHQRTLRVNDPAEAPVGGLEREGIRSLLSAPLLFRGELVGVLNLFNRKSGQAFSEEEERVLALVAAQAAQVLHAARLIGELRESRSELETENRKLVQRLHGGLTTEIVGGSRALTQVLRLIERIRSTAVDVLVTGESGTGKELLARTVHESSPRSDGPFVALNCAALPDTLLETELFGVEKGVATGVDQRAGQFEAAEGGTLFLDEIGDLSLVGQAKILRALQERVIQRVGGRETFAIDVRVIAATNKDLAAEVKEGRFREDLYYRLKVIHLH